MALAFLKMIILMTASLALSACMVGPDFVKPKSPATSSYAPGGDPRKIGSQRINHHKSVVARWWNEFHSPQLNKMIQLALKNNYDLASARETLEQAKERVMAQSGQLWPQLNFNAAAGRQKYGVALFGPINISIPPYSYYELGPSFNLLVDVFGGTRRNIEKQRALATYQKEVLQGTFLDLTGSIATTVLLIATTNEQISTTKQIIDDDRKNLNLVKEAFRLGSGTKTEVLSARSQLENDETLLPPLYQQLSEAQSTLSVLTGIPPANWQPPHFKLHDFALPQKLSLISPSQLAQRRPDILAAEAMLHAANANVGIATANLYPSINLSGSMMQEALSPSNLFKASANAWSYLGGLTAPIFNGGSLRAELRAAQHAYKAAYANYQQVTLKAYSQVNNTLHALKYDELALSTAKRATYTARASLHLARLSYKAGNVGILQVLDAERLYTQARLDYVRAKAQRYQDTVQLYVVLGG